MVASTIVGCWCNLRWNLEEYIAYTTNFNAWNGGFKTMKIVCVLYPYFYKLFFKTGQGWDLKSMEGIGRLEFRTWGSTYIIFLFARGGCKMKTLKSNLPKYRVGNFKKTQKFSKKRKRSNYWSQCIKKARFWWCFSIAYRIREKQIWGKK